ncbi:MAG: hypothetical protein ACJ762_09610 [Solirubrobacteraceae bacterium]
MRLTLWLVIAALVLLACGGSPQTDEQHGKPLTTGTHTGPADTATSP